MTEKNWRIGDSFQINGDFTGNRIKKAKPNSVETENRLKDLAQRVMTAMEEQNHPAPEIKYERLLYHPNPKARFMAEITDRIIELRDKKGLKWIEIKKILEKDNVKTFTGKRIWHPGTLCRIYKRAVSN